MPKLLMILGYQVSIWSNENGEPIHVHISKRRPTSNSYKLWLTRNGKFIPANPRDTRIPKNDLKNIILKLNDNAMYIRNCWVAYHGYERYYM